MMPVAPQPEPASFQAKVRVPGQRWLFKTLYPTRALNLPVPLGMKFPPHWTKCLPEFHAAYGGICAYLGTHIELATGAASVDHFAPKSRAAGAAYEWDNYRLACLDMNARKNHFTDLLDPFTLPPRVFLLVLTTGEMYLNPALTDPVLTDAARRTVARLQLDSAVKREMRSRLFAEYKAGTRPGPLMRRYHPYVWSEIERQGQS